MSRLKLTPAKGDWLWGLLKSLPAVRFAISLGGGMVMTLFSVWVTWVLAYDPWPKDVAEARVKALGFALVVALGLIGIVLVSTAFGKIGKVAVTLPTGGGAEIDFDDDPPPPAGPPAA